MRKAMMEANASSHIVEEELITFPNQTSTHVVSQQMQ
jgi:hypothetical protein